MRFLLLALILFAAGCGSSESTEPVATTEVQMAKSYRFDPKTIEIEAGDTVTWTNADNFTHTVQVDGQEDHKVERGERVDLLRHTGDVPLRLHAAQARHGRRGDRQVRLAEFRGDVVIPACAVSAGIHAALLPDTSPKAPVRASASRASRSVRPVRRRAHARAGESSVARRRGGRLHRLAPELRARGDDRRAGASSRTGGRRPPRARHQGDRARRPHRGGERPVATTLRREAVPASAHGDGRRLQRARSSRSRATTAMRTRTRRRR